MIFNIMCAGQNGKHLGLKNCGISSKGKAEPSSNREHQVTYVMQSSQATTRVISKQNPIFSRGWSATILMMVLWGLHQQGVITR
jgi:hypothetical protein